MVRAHLGFFLGEKNKFDLKRRGCFVNYDPQAIELNNKINKVNPYVYEMLSERGKKIFFPKMGILSQSAEAVGKEINATVGTALEDNGEPLVLNSIYSQVNLKNKDCFSYAPSYGRNDIRKKWKEMMINKNPSLKGKSFSTPVVTIALTHGLSMGGYLFVDEGDTIISPDRYWENYDLVFCNAYNAKIKTFPMFTDDENFNIDGLKQKLEEDKSNKKIIILNFPNNPTGYTVKESEAVEIKNLLIEEAEKGNNIVVLIDDAYFGLVYEDNILKESIFSLLCDAHQRILAVKFDGPTKEDYVWGFRVGFMTFGIKGGTEELYTTLEAKAAGAIRGSVSNVSNLSQCILLSAYNNPSYENEKKEKYNILQKRYKKVKEIFEAHPEYRNYFSPLPFNSGYFMCIKIKNGNAEAVRKVLLTKYNTGTIALNDLIRIAFSSTPYDKLEKLFDNCYKAAMECTN